MCLVCSQVWVSFSNEGLYLSLCEFEVGEFVRPLLIRYKKALGLTLYEDWLLEFLNKRQAFLMLLETSKSHLLTITKYRLKLDSLVDELEEDVKGLIKIYPV